MVCSNQRSRAPPTKQKERLTDWEDRKCIPLWKVQRIRGADRRIRKSCGGANNVETSMRILESGCGCRDGVCWRKEKMYAAVFQRCCNRRSREEGQRLIQIRCGGVQLVDSMPFRILRCCSGGSWREIEKRRKI